MYVYVTLYKCLLLLLLIPCKLHGYSIIPLNNVNTCFIKTCMKRSIVICEHQEEGDIIKDPVCQRHMAICTFCTF